MSIWSFNGLRGPLVTHVHPLGGKKDSTAESITVAVEGEVVGFCSWCFLSLSLLFLYQNTDLKFTCRYRKCMYLDGYFCQSFKFCKCSFQLETANMRTHNGSVFRGSKLMCTRMQRRKVTAESHQWQWRSADGKGILAVILILTDQDKSHRKVHEARNFCAISIFCMVAPPS